MQRGVDICVSHAGAACVTGPYCTCSNKGQTKKKKTTCYLKEKDNAATSVDS